MPLLLAKVAVIPGRRETASPESIFTVSGYGFRAPRFARPRNDAMRSTAIAHPAEWRKMLGLQSGWVNPLDFGRTAFCSGLTQPRPSFRPDVAQSSYRG